MFVPSAEPAAEDRNQLLFFEDDSAGEEEESATQKQRPAKRGSLGVQVHRLLKKGELTDLSPLVKFQCRRSTDGKNFFAKVRGRSLTVA